MLGLMQDWPLLIHRIIDHAATYHGGRQVISRFRISRFPLARSG